MIKKIFMPKVVVYRDVIDDVNGIFDVVKQSQLVNDSNQNYFIKKWESWNDSGLISNASLFVDNKHEMLQTEIGRVQYESLMKINNAFWEVMEDYIDEWKNYDGWPYIKNWNIKRGDNSNQLVQTDQNLLMYYPDLSRRLALSYHTDNHQYDTDSKGWKLFITLTVYLNDDYEDGELSFIKEDTNEISYYKPKAGDITVFPSMLPYFHGVEPISKGKKYLSRMFFAINYEGSEEWNNSVKKYGEEKFLKMEETRIKRVWNDQKYFRVPIFLDDDLNDELIKKAHGQIIKFPYLRKKAKEDFLIRWDDEI